VPGPGKIRSRQVPDHRSGLTPGQGPIRPWPFPSTKENLATPRSAKSGQPPAHQLESGPAFQAECLDLGPRSPSRIISLGTAFFGQTALEKIGASEILASPVICEFPRWWLDSPGPTSKAHTRPCQGDPPGRGQMPHTAPSIPPSKESARQRRNEPASAPAKRQDSGACSPAPPSSLKMFCRPHCF